MRGADLIWRATAARLGGVRNPPGSATLADMMVDSRTESTAARSPRPLRLPRELALLGGALAVGVFVIPLLIWLAGHATLGPYTRGDTGPGYGPLTLYGNYFSGLGHGWIMYWSVAVGPVVLLIAVRLWLALIRRLPRD